MADRTLTSGPAYLAASAGGPTAKFLHEGTVVVTRKWVGTGNGQTTAQTVSGSEVVQFFKIPNGAVITSLHGYGWFGSAGNATVALGFVGGGQGIADLHAGVTLSNTATTVFGFGNLIAGSLPVKVSTSDDAANNFVYLTAKFVSVATATTSYALSLTVQYNMDNGTI